MEYKYAKIDNYEDFASGRVLYHMGGEPTFPVRLTLELYERCRQYSARKTELTIYDCCCGGAYMLTVLGLLKGNTIAKLYGSDINERSIWLAEDNLSLLTEAGIRKRRMQLEALYSEFGKESHREALESINRIEKRLTNKLTASVFVRNALKPVSLPFIPDLIITDVPYGQMAEWNEGSGGINQMMDAIYENCSEETILCICMDKKQKIQTDKFQRLERQVVGKRKFEIYKL